jgi:hypothetical protein
MGGNQMLESIEVYCRVDINVLSGRDLFSKEIKLLCRHGKSVIDSLVVWSVFRAWSLG